MMCARKRVWKRGLIHHLGPESSIASTTSEDSSMKSEYLGVGFSHDLNLGVSTFWEASHFSAKPSPSNILSTSDILGRSDGLNLVHRRATLTISSNSILSKLVLRSLSTSWLSFPSLCNLFTCKQSAQNNLAKDKTNTSTWWFYSCNHEAIYWETIMHQMQFEMNYGSHFLTSMD